MAEPSKEGGGRVLNGAQALVAVILGFAALHWLGAIVTPLLLAIFLAIMVDGLTRLLRRRLPGLPGSAALVGAILILSGLCLVSALVMIEQAGGFIDNLSRAQPRLNGLIRATAAQMHLRRPASINQMLTHLNPSAWLGTVALALQGILSNVLLVLIYLGFLIAARKPLERKLVKLFRDRERRHEAARLIERVRDSIERYLWIQTITGLMIAAASWAGMALIGLDNAVFWAFLIFIVNYVPIVGAVAAIVLPALFAVVQFGALGPAAILLSALFAITFVVGNIVLPRMQGDSLNMDPLVVLLSLAFWGALWGLTGMFLSTPLTVLAMLILAQFEESRWAAVLLSADGEPERMLSGEPSRPRGHPSRTPPPPLHA